MNSNSPFFIHESAICDSKQIGADTRIWGFTHILAGAQIGARVNIGEHVYIENKVLIGNGCTIKNGVALWDLVTLEDDVFVGPYVVFTNDLKPRAFIKRPISEFLPTLIQRGATLGANCTLICGITIGKFALVAAGSVVTKDVPPHTLVMGNPAIAVAKVCYCGERLDADAFCESCACPLEQNSIEQVASLFRGNS